ncbi:HTTM domain-containing protein [Bacillus subtilis]|uniref:HTTM domain-containing protein n=1 Tax=Bacillus subtilis TaxID=1423 RepID=UPI001C22F112|nr:HTTM domain-containing protein [Bacillus subtilis]MBU8678456.1 HTTM domain-containing protein [Bacillus subtilis]
MKIILSKFRNFNHLMSNKMHYLIGSSILRIFIGLHIMFTYLIHFAQRNEIWGPNAFYSFEKCFEAYGFTSLYLFSDSQLYFEFIFISGIVINTLYILGYKMRIVSIINFIWVWSLYQRNPYIHDGGNNILILIMLYLIFASLGEFFTIHTESRSKEKSKVTIIIHNFSVMISMIQVSLLYFFAGFNKAQGKMWTHGTALYYILQVDEYSINKGFTNLVIDNPYLLVLGTYSALFLQLMFPILVWNRYFKIPLLIGSILFHLSIIIFMGLLQFGVIMIALDLLFITDTEYRKLYKFLSRIYDKFKLKFRNIFNQKLRNPTI